jgi:hypothetical protein
MALPKWQFDVAVKKVLKWDLAAFLGHQKGVDFLARDLLFGFAEIRNGKSEKIKKYV